MDKHLERELRIVFLIFKILLLVGGIMMVVNGNIWGYGLIGGYVGVVQDA